MPAPSTSTGVTITNPLVLYRALLATKRIDPDPAQHRLAVHLQKLYERLKDYEPVVEYSHRLSQISRTLSHSPSKAGFDATKETTRRNGWLGSLFESKKEKEALALTRVLTSHEAAMQMDSPMGLMLHGEVGTGKSMLIDLFADCLPNKKKKRWHFTTFMLDTMAQLEQLRRSRQMVIPTSLGQQDDYSLLWLARNMISTSPILFLDEFQLPDRAASKILTNLLTSFFHLGGVLIATSNRMPEELAKAAGMEFAPPPPSRLDSLKWTFGFANRMPPRSLGLFSGPGDFAAFLDVLKARCEVWEMGSGRDYRRRESESQVTNPTPEEVDGTTESSIAFDGLEPMKSGNVGLGYEQSQPLDGANVERKVSSVPKNFLIKPLATASEEERLQWTESHKSALERTFGDQESSLLEISSWNPGILKVYGRSVIVPRQHNGVASWTFFELCASTLGPADYITLASTFHTLILTDVPILNILQKNGARRFITLLDALYEAKCKLFITADAGPDELFFPETLTSGKKSNMGNNVETVNQDAVYAETFAEAYQDATAPFRPNISMYSTSSTAGLEPEPDRTHSRLAGLFSDDQLEDQPPNRPQSQSQVRRSGSIFGHDSHTSLDERDVRGSAPHGGVDFSKSGTFTGEDEQFAYKRARSRLWEMCGERWWARTGDDWWKPLERAARAWEGPVVAAAADARGGLDLSDMSVPAPEAVGEGAGIIRDVTEQQDEVMFRHGASPFRTSRDPPPKISDVHVWGVMKWGKKAGAWGKGVEGLGDRGKEKGQRPAAEGKVERKERDVKKSVK